MGFPESSVGKEYACNAGYPSLIPGSGRFLGWEDPLDSLPIPVFLGFPCGSAGKESTCKGGDLGSIPWLGRSPGDEKGYPLQYSGLENSMDCMVHGVPKGGFPHSSLGKEFACNAVDLGLIPGLGRSAGEEKGYPLQYSGLENFMD